MGNVFNCLKQLKPSDKATAKKRIMLIVQDSVANNSTTSNPSTLSFLTLNQSVNTNLKSEFNWSRIQSIYLGCTSSLDDDLHLSLPMVKTVEKLFDILEDDLLLNCRKICMSITHLGNKFTTKFNECTKLSSNVFRIKHNSDRMAAHVISVIKMHRLILIAFESDIEQAQDILDLIALSHIVMNVTPSDFKLLDIAIEKFLLKSKIIDEDTVKVIISYFSLITNYMCKYIEQNKEHSLVNDLIRTDTEDTDKRRVHLRQLRKWRVLVEKLRLETSTYIEEISKENRNSNIPLEESKSFKFKKQCPLGNLRDIYPD